MNVSTEKFELFFKSELSSNLPILNKLFLVFDDHLNEFVKEISKQDDFDFEKVKKASHKIRPSCKSFGAIELFETLLNLEENPIESKRSDVENELAQCERLAKNSLQEIGVLVANLNDQPGGYFE